MVLSIGERRIPVQLADDGVGDGGRLSSDELTVSVPISRGQFMHGAAVIPERYVGPFINPPSERTLRQERSPQAWVQKTTPGVRAAVHRQQHVNAPVHLCDAVRHEARRSPPRPATAGAELKAPTWSLPHASTPCFDLLIF